MMEMRRAIDSDDSKRKTAILEEISLRLFLFKLNFIQIQFRFADFRWFQIRDLIFDGWRFHRKIFIKLKRFIDDLSNWKIKKRKRDGTFLLHGFENELAFDRSTATDDDGYDRDFFWSLIIGDWSYPFIFSSVLLRSLIDDNDGKTKSVEISINNLQ